MKRLLLASLLLLASCAGSTPESTLADARVALDAGNLQVARAKAESVHREDPERKDARAILASVHRELATRNETAGELERAHNAYVRAGELEPRRAMRAQDWWKAYESGRNAGLESRRLGPYLESSLEADPSSAEIHAVAAEHFDLEGDLKAAARHYLWLWEADRTALNIGLRLGGIYSELEEWEDAEAVFRRVLEADPGNVQAKLRLADAYENQRRDKSAREIYLALVEEYPDNAMILFRYADFLEQQGDRERAAAVRAQARGELPGVERREMRELKRRKKR